MNQLPAQKKIETLEALMAGTSLQDVARKVDVSINTIKKLSNEIGTRCCQYHLLNFTNLRPGVIECSVQLAASKAKSTIPVGSTSCVWIAKDQRSNFIVSYMVGDYTRGVAKAFVADLKKRAQSDEKILFSLGSINVDPEQYVQAKFDEAMDGMSWGFMNIENHVAQQEGSVKSRMQDLFLALALHIMFQNYITIDDKMGVTPAMKLKVTDRRWSVEELLTC
jgi:hypothetical protein